MSPRAIFNVLVALGAVLVIVLVAGPEIDLGGGDEELAGDSAAPREPASPSAEAKTTREERPTRTDSPQENPVRTTEEAREPKPKLPANPDEVKGNQEISLHRPANLRRALRVLERERRRAEGVFDGLRIAPGRIDSTVNTSRKKVHLQVRPDFEIAFRSDSDFPNSSDPRFRRRGLGAGAVDLNLPARILRRIDRQREGSSARDLDYFVIRRDIIDLKVNYGAYLRSGPQPRIFLLEPGEPFRAIG